MSRIKSFIKASGIYFIGNISCKLVSFLLLPLYTEILAPDQMGTYDVSVAYMSFFMSLLYLDIPSSTLRFMMDKEGAEKYKTIKISYIIFSMSTVCYVVSMIIAGVPEETAREALRLAMHKLPVKCKFLSKEIENNGGDNDEDK